MDSTFPDFVAGWFAGAAGLVVGHPFDTLKARIQTDITNKFGDRFRTFNSFRHVAMGEGPRALFKGMLSPLIGMAAINSILFGVHATVMNKLQPEGGIPTIWKSFVAGAVGGAAQVPLICLIDLSKLRLQCQENPTPTLSRAAPSAQRLYSDPWDCMKKLYSEYGITGLNRGFWITMIREVPGYGAYFASYYYTCKLFLRMQHKEVRTLDDVGPLELSVAGGIGGIVGWVVVYPIDVLKSRLQVDGMYGTHRYNGMWDCFVKSYRDEMKELRNKYELDPVGSHKPTAVRGFRVFVKGLNSTVIRAFPVNGVIFATYSLILRYWRNMCE